MRPVFFTLLAFQAIGLFIVDRFPRIRRNPIMRLIFWRFFFSLVFDFDLSRFSSLDDAMDGYLFLLSLQLPDNLRSHAR